MDFSRGTFYKLNLVANKLFGTNIMTSSVGRVLHRYRKGHGFKSRTGLNFFHYCEVTSLSSDHVCDFHIFTSIIHQFTGLFGTSMMTSSQLLAQLVEHCIGIAEVMSSNHVQALLSLLFKQCLLLRRLLSY